MLTDVASGATTTMSYADEPLAWVSHGSCVRLTVTLGTSGAAVLHVISSGPLSFASSDDTSACSVADVLVGDDAQSNNPADYELANEENCVDASFGTHSWVSDYSWIDEPVGSLGAHYHTRGAMYYVLYGEGAKFNEKLNVTSEFHNATLNAGEIRYVAPGVYYGPEEVIGGESVTYLSSIHEPDPSAVDPDGGGSSTQCPFACFKRTNASAAHCRKRGSASALDAAAPLSNDDKASDWGQSDDADDDHPSTDPAGSDDDDTESQTHSGRKAKHVDDDAADCTPPDCR